MGVLGAFVGKSRLSGMAWSGQKKTRRSGPKRRRALRRIIQLMNALQRLPVTDHAGRQPIVRREADYSPFTSGFFKIGPARLPKDIHMRTPHFIVSRLALTLLLGAAGVAQADVCFTVLDAGGRVLHQSRKAPVDMSRPISETLNRRFPNASLMVFGSNNDTCQEMHTEAAPAVVTAPRRARRM